MLRSNGIRNPVVVAAYGEEALDWLEHDPSVDASSSTAVVDLDMPRMSGIEFLEGARASPRLRHLLFYVLTSSDQQGDIGLPA